MIGSRHAHTLHHPRNTQQHTTIITLLGVLLLSLFAHATTAPSASAAVPSTNVFPIQGQTATSSCANSFGAFRAPDRTHQGDDCFANRGTPLLAVENGRIEAATPTDTGLGGITLWLKGDSGTSYYYAHNDRNVVSVGARVSRGQRIADVGKTGNARNTPPHVHFQIHPGGRGTTAVDPYPHLRQWSTSSGNPPLYFVKTSNTGTGKVEIHNATASSNYQSTSIANGTRFNLADRTNGVFQTVGSDLWFVKTRNATSGKVEVHNATHASNFQSATVARATRFSAADGGNGVFQVVGSNLYFIKTRNTGSGRIEVHTATASSGYQSGSSRTTRFGVGEAANGTFQMSGADLYFIKTRNTGTGKVEVHNATSSSGYQSSTVASGTRFSLGDVVNGVFQVNGRDLYFIKTRNTGTGKIEVHNATASSNYQTATIASGSRFAAAERNNGTFQIRP